MKLFRSIRSRFLHSAKFALLWLAVQHSIAPPAEAALVSFSAAGRVTVNSSVDATIPAGTPWSFELIYDTAAPDLDFVLTGEPDPTFGRFTNEGAIPALIFFHYRAGTYEVTLDAPADFGLFSNVDVTFLAGVHAIDINVQAAGSFPPLAGGPVSFHADFNDATHLAFVSDALPTNAAISLQNFQNSSVTLLPPNGVILGTQADMTTLTISPIPEPSTAAISLLGAAALLLIHRRKSNLSLRSNGAR
jgi:hypothetical protein